MSAQGALPPAPRSADPLPLALQETYKLPHRLIEKKRRDRINECIAQLKDLLPEHLKLTVGWSGLPGPAAAVAFEQRRPRQRFPRGRVFSCHCSGDLSGFSPPRLPFPRVSPALRWPHARGGLQTQPRLSRDRSPRGTPGGARGAPLTLPAAGPEEPPAGFPCAKVTVSAGAAELINKILSFEVCGWSQNTHEIL